MKTRSWVLILLSVGLGGCGAEQQAPMACAAYAAAGLSVSVQSTVNAQPICDATVTASEGSYSERLFGSSCNFSGAYERPGTYVVEASRQGFQTGRVASVKVVMGGGQCPHVEVTRVTVQLTPEGSAQSPLDEPAAERADEADEAPGEGVRGLVRGGTLERRSAARVLACLGASQLVPGVRPTRPGQIGLAGLAVPW